jgi:hypothetical protein
LQEYLVADPSYDPTVVRHAEVDWTSVLAFYALACAFSWPFFWWRDVWSASWQAWHFPGFLKTSTYMWGPGLAALVILGWRRRTHARTITFFGSARSWSCTFYLVPLVALALAYLPSAGLRGPAVAGVLGAIGWFNILGEELGWRGFLQDALRPLPRGWRYLVIGVMWEAWHFTNRTHGREPAEVVRTLAVSYPIVIALSTVLGEATDRSRSLLVAVTLHFWADALFEVPSFMQGSALATYAVFGGAIVFWALLLWRWPTRSGIKEGDESSNSSN